MTRMIFVNLPVSDLGAATSFYESIGCTKNPAFSDENASSMMWSDQIIFMLLTRDYFSTFTSKPIADSSKECAHLLALSMDSKEQVDRIVETAGTSGGKPDVRDPQDFGFMYSRAFEDPDGNIFEPVWMDPNASGPEAA